MANVAVAQVPVAGFSASTTRGCASLRIRFTDQSTGAPSSWIWRFGSLGSSTQQNPTFDFPTPGKYTIKLTVRNQQGSDSITRTDYIEVLASPIADFSASILGGCIPFSTTFNDLSNPVAGTIATRNWNFDDGTLSAAVNPTHTFVNPGEFNITLKVTNAAGCSDSVTKAQYIKTSSPITAGFRNTQAITCRTPETINFTDQSVGIRPLFYEWFFGDGDTSQRTDPAHTYTTAGTYAVKLVIRNTAGCRDSITINRAVTINNIQTSFSGPDSVCAGSSQLFTNNSGAPVNAAAWYSGNALVSSQVTGASFTWSNPGTYLVKLVNTYGSCTDSFTRSIRVLGLPTTAFTATNTSACQGPLVTTFNNSSTGAVSWLWDFGDGQTDNSRNPTHTYTAQGAYTVSLTATGSNGCSRRLVRNNLVIIRKPFVRIANLPAEGCVPFTHRAIAGISSVDGLATVTWHDGQGNIYNGATPPPFVYTNPGNYTVKLFATTTGGCIDSAIVTDGIRTGTKPVADFTASTVTPCTFQPVTFTNQSTTSDKWWWQFRDTLITTEHATYSARDTGRYSVTLIASNNGCRDTVTKNNFIRSLPPIARFNVRIDCNNQLQVSFSDSSVSPLSWNWDFGDGNLSSQRNPTHLYGNLGQYTVRLTAGNGSCTHTDSTRIRLLAVNPGFTVSDTTSCKHENLRFTATGMTAGDIATYQWDFGDGETALTNSPTVTHRYTQSGRFDVRLTVTDINNCSYSVSRPGLIRVNGPRAVFNVSPQSGCAPLQSTFTDASTSDGTNTLASWKWHFGNNQSQTLMSPPNSPLAYTYTDTGTFYPSLVVTDQIGCRDSLRAPAPVFVTKPKAAFISSNSNICTNNDVQFSNVARGIGLSYLWQFGDNTSSTAPNENKRYTATGNYSVKLVITDINGCKDSVERLDLVRVQNVQADFEMSDSVTSCSPIDIFFTNNSLFSITQTWDFGDGTSSTLPNPTHRYLAPGTYAVKLTARRSSNCISEITKTVRVFSSDASLTILSPLTGCQPHRVVLKASTAGPVRYEWDFNDGQTLLTSDSLVTHIFDSTGSFLPVARLRDSTGCILTARATDSIRIVGSDLDFTTSKSLLCGRESIRFQNTTRTPAGTVFRWDFGDGTSSPLTSPVHQYGQNGLYTVTLTARSPFGCLDTLKKFDFIKVVTQPDIAITGPASFCGPTQALFSGQILQTDSLPLLWSWDFGNGSTASVQQPPAQTFLFPQTYAIRASVINPNGCLDTATFLYTIHPVPPVDVIPDSVVCLGNAIILKATGATSYSWQPTVNLSCTNCNNPVARLTNNTRYTVTGKNDQGCVGTDSVLVSVQQPFRISYRVSDDTLCVGTSIQLNASGADRYRWTPATGLAYPESGNTQATPFQSTRFMVVGSDKHNCFADTGYLPVVVYPIPEVNAGEDKIVNPGTSVRLSTLFSSDVTRWLWTPPTRLSCADCPAPIATPEFNQTYRITVYNPGGCSASDEINVRLSCDNSNLNLPNAFTPNNDGRNDILYPKSTGIYSIQSFVIYNRQGEVVFRNGNFPPNVQSAGWNGLYKGVPAAVGSYVYEISCICNNNNVLRFTGNITLIR